MSQSEGRTCDADCLALSSAEWVPRALEGLEQPAGRTRQVYGWRWWARIETAESEYNHSQLNWD